MQQRNGKFGNFLFCPNQHACKQKTITVRAINFTPEYAKSSLSNATSKSTSNEMAQMAFENDYEHEMTHDRGSIDPVDVVFGGMFCDMGIYDDDVDQRPW